MVLHYLYSPVDAIVFEVINKGIEKKLNMLNINEESIRTKLQFRYNTLSNISSFPTIKFIIAVNFNARLICKYKSSPPDVFLAESVLKIYSNFIGEYPCRTVILIKRLSNNR